MKEKNPDRPLPSWSPAQPPGSPFHQTSSPWAQDQLNTLKMVTNTHVSLARQSIHHLVILFFLVLWFMNYRLLWPEKLQETSSKHWSYQRLGWATTLLPTVSSIFGALSQWQFVKKPKEEVATVLGQKKKLWLSFPVTQHKNKHRKMENKPRQSNALSQAGGMCDKGWIV